MKGKRHSKIVNIAATVLVMLLPIAFRVLMERTGRVSANEKVRMPRITLGEPVVVAVSSRGESRWGFYSFPDMWRAPAGEIYLAMNVGEDANDVGERQPTQFFISGNQGKSWQPIAQNQVDFSPDFLTLPSGEQVAFGTEKYVYHYSTYGPRKRDEYLLNDLGLKPVMTNGKRTSVAALYRYADLPTDIRRIPMARRSRPDAAWNREYATLEASDLLLRVLIRERDASGKWHDVPPKVSLTPRDSGSVFWPERVIVLPGGTLLWPLSTQDPRIDKMFFRVQCAASTDGGRTWKIRGTIADQHELATWGYGCGEQSMQRMPNGDLLCVMRTRMDGNNLEGSNYLAAARSSDNGYTWMAPTCRAPFSVTPHLRTLKNNTVAMVYGRPGVHVRASADSGGTWCTPVPVVGPPEAELMAAPLQGDRWRAKDNLADRWGLSNVITCSNTDVVITGPDRFIVAYSDFQHDEKRSQWVRAIKVREVVVTPPLAGGSSRPHPIQRHSLSADKSSSVSP